MAAVEHEVALLVPSRRSVAHVTCSVDDFPSNDKLIHEVLATLKANPSGLECFGIERCGCSVRTGHESLLTASKSDRKVLIGSVAYCVTILVREGLATSTKHMRQTATRTRRPRASNREKDSMPLQGQRD